MTHQLKEIIRQLFNQLRDLKNQLHLDIEEILSTMILGIIDINFREGELITIGDGLISHDGEIIEYEQNNKPDYIGYHLDEDFDTWFSKQNQILSLKEINDLSISTDGIFTFKNFDNEQYPFKSNNEIIDFLLKYQNN